MKKFLAILLAAMMLLATAGMALAEDTTSFAGETVTDNSGLTGHTFVGYQIFSATQAADPSTGDPSDENNNLSNVKWGDGIDAEKFARLLKEAGWHGYDLETITVDQVLSALTGMSSDAAKQVARIAYQCRITDKGVPVEVDGVKTVFTPGYYLFVDETKFADDETDTVFNAALLQMTRKGTFEITKKTDKPGVEKKVWENDYTTTPNSYYGDNFNDVADYSIGDTVTFRFYSVIPDMTFFDIYNYKFHDTMSAGLTFEGVTSVKVCNFVYDAMNNIVGTTAVTDVAYTVTKAADEGEAADGHTFHVTVPLKKPAVLGEDKTVIEPAINYAAGMLLIVEYTATLNEDAVINWDGNPNEVYLEYSNNPDESDSTGKTPTDQVIVFTYDINVLKVDGSAAEKTPLANVEFVLYKEINNTDALQKLYAVLATDADDGCLYVTDWVAATDDSIPDTATRILTGADGMIRIKGLEDGTYYATETKAADDSYNLLTTPVTLELVATTVNDHSWAGDAEKALTARTNLTEEDPLEIENNKGAVLPETGGIGTTLFYLLGGIMAAGSALILVVRRRAGAEEE
ncbi:MAG: isopeptide-forming domain-containing fimbrial protein [Aristaeellaceae bacterium]